MIINIILEKVILFLVVYVLLFYNIEILRRIRKSRDFSKMKFWVFEMLVIGIVSLLVFKFAFLFPNYSKAEEIFYYNYPGKQIVGVFKEQEYQIISFKDKQKLIYSYYFIIYKKNAQNQWQQVDVNDYRGTTTRDNTIEISRYYFRNENKSLLMLISNKRISNVSDSLSDQFVTKQFDGNNYLCFSVINGGEDESYFLRVNGEEINFNFGGIIND